MPHIPHLRIERHETMYGGCRNITATVVQYDPRGKLVSQHRFGVGCHDLYAKGWIVSVVRESGSVKELPIIETADDVAAALHNEFDAEYAAQLEIVRDVMDAA